MNYLTASNWTRWKFIVDDPDFHVYPFEKFDYVYLADWVETWADPLIFSMAPAYLLSIWLLRRWMKNREPLDLRWLLIPWNVLVALFSILATVRIWAELSLIWRTVGFHAGVCHRVEGHVSTAFYGAMTSFSKMALMSETFFLVLRKKHVDTAHVVHHVLAPCFTGKLCTYAEPSFRWMGIANVLTLSIDYPLMTLMAMGKPFPKSRLIMVTLEVMQMLWIIFISGYTMLQRAMGMDCMRHPSSIAIANGIAISILVLVIATAFSPGYWKRDDKRYKSRVNTTTACSLEKEE